MSEKQEIWKPIKEYEGLYEISSLGNVKSLPKKWDNGMGIISHNGIIMQPCKNSRGYTLVTLTKDGKHKTKMIHRMVALAFIDNEFNKPFINHKNGIKHDNKITNLEWCTESENVYHAYRTNLQTPPMLGKFGGNHGAAKKVKNIKTGKIFGSIKEAAKSENINKGHLCLSLRGKRTNRTNFIYA